MFQVAYILSIVGSVSILLPFVGLIILLIRERKSDLNSDIFYLSLYIIIITLAQTLIFVYALGKRANFQLFNFFYPFEFSFFIYIALQWFAKIRQFCSTIAIVAFVFSTIIISITASENKFPFILVLIESTFLIPIVFNAVIQMVRSTYDLYRLTMFKAILFYCLGNLVMVVFIGSLLNEANIMQSIFNIYANYLFLRTFIYYGEKVKDGHTINLY